MNDFVDKKYYSNYFFIKFYERTKNLKPSGGRTKQLYGN